MEIYNIMNNTNQKSKPKFNIITKGPLRKQIIISMNTNNSKRLIAQANNHITDINRLLKDVKSEISADFIRSNNKRIVITTNKVVASSDLNIVEKYMKELNNIDLNDVMSLRLLQSKSYLKILDILYFQKNTNLPVMSNIIKRVIKSTHIFDDMVLAFHPQVIKASSKSDIAIIWVDICDLQNGMKVKCLINRCFNVGYHITIIRRINMNPGVLQCKNCWK